MSHQAVARFDAAAGLLGTVTCPYSSKLLQGSSLPPASSIVAHLVFSLDSGRLKPTYEISRRFTEAVRSICPVNLSYAAFEFAPHANNAEGAEVSRALEQDFWEQMRRVAQRWPVGAVGFAPRGSGKDLTIGFYYPRGVDPVWMARECRKALNTII